MTITSNGQKKKPKKIPKLKSSLIKTLSATACTVLLNWLYSSSLKFKSQLYVEMQ